MDRRKFVKAFGTLIILAALVAVFIALAQKTFLAWLLLIPIVSAVITVWLWYLGEI